MHSLKEVRDLIMQRKTLEMRAALDAISVDTLSEADQHEWKRLKSHDASLLNKMELALSLRESIALSPYATLADYFMTADIALELELQEKALIYLSKTITASIEQNQPWFLSACYMRRAYLHILNGDTALALQDIEHLDDDDGPDVSLPNIPALTKKTLLTMAASQPDSQRSRGGP